MESTTKNINKLFTIITIAMIYLYKCLSSVTTSSCRFLPTCSSYGIQALKEHGAIKATPIIIKRLLRCHPWGNFGIDEIKKVEKVKNYE